MRRFGAGPGAGRTAALSAFVLLCGAIGAAGQEQATPPGNPFPPGVQEVDRVVAIVGDTALLLSELRQEMFRLRASGTQVPAEGTEAWDRFARQVVDAATDQLIVLQEAKRAGLTPQPQQVEQLAESYYQQARQGFSSDEQLQEAVENAGMNMLQYRQMLRSRAESESLVQAYHYSLQQRTDLPPVVVDEREVEAYFERNFSDQSRPALVSFNQLIVIPTPSGAARDSAIARALRARQEIIDGEDFAVVARRYSDEESTREEGGELGWLRRDDVVKPFGDAAWAARPGSVVGPVETRFGLHLIKIENSRGGERFLRHILIRPEIKESDLADARERARALVDSLAAGVDPERLQRMPGVLDEQIRFDNIQLTQLAGRFGDASREALASPVEGQVYGPFETETGTRPQLAVVQVVRFRPAGPVQLDEYRDRIRREIRLSKQIDLLLSEVRENTYIDVKL